VGNHPLVAPPHLAAPQGGEARYLHEWREVERVAGARDVRPADRRAGDVYLLRICDKFLDLCLEILAETSSP
jgi:hypothetical protein